MMAVMWGSAYESARELMSRANQAGAEAVRLTEPADPEHAARLTNVGTLLRLRYERTDALADLDAAIRFTADALRTTPHDYPYRTVIDDDTAVTIAHDFYAHFANSRHAALALHETIRRARDRCPQTPSLWAAHIHSGI